MIEPLSFLAGAWMTGWFLTVMGILLLPASLLQRMSMPAHLLRMAACGLIWPWVWFRINDLRHMR